jgi:hypothetical protein
LRNAKRQGKFFRSSCDFAGINDRFHGRNLALLRKKIKPC